jgi:hypothetical protein
MPTGGPRHLVSAYAPLRVVVKGRTRAPAPSRAPVPAFP